LKVNLKSISKSFPFNIDSFVYYSAIVTFVLTVVLVVSVGAAQVILKLKHSRLSIF
jgi:hypothetical protein